MLPDCIAVKCCTRCGYVKPATLEYFPKDMRTKSGLCSHCRICIAEKAANWYYDNHPRALKTRSVYQKNHRREINDSRRTPEYREKSNKRARARYAVNKVHIRARQNEWIYKNPDKRKQYAATWNSKNPDIKLAATHRRRARILSAEGTYTQSDIIKIGDLQKWLCWWCGEYCKDEYHIDHRVALTRGGTNWPSNLVIACPHCNLSKQNKLPHEWSNRLL